MVGAGAEACHVLDRNPEATADERGIHEHAVEGDRLDAPRQPIQPDALSFAHGAHVEDEDRLRPEPRQRLLRGPDEPEDQEQREDQQDPVADEVEREDEDDDRADDGEDGVDEGEDAAAEALLVGGEARAPLEERSNAAQREEECGRRHEREEEIAASALEEDLEDVLDRVGDRAGIGGFSSELLARDLERGLEGGAPPEPVLAFDVEGRDELPVLRGLRGRVELLDRLVDGRALIARDRRSRCAGDRSRAVGSSPVSAR